MRIKRFLTKKRDEEFCPSCIPVQLGTDSVKDESEHENWDQG
ncbi:hypothetical protein IPA_03375 [Ignicoccus pacificus DSM 13166]|uniref:Uncharacterized protein n=1 Tax=Ignicoccus pacificus DSM 13166 TaxID=940294 RepID=A0A977PK04_9CREN|nr:hypothetical protein IPA_03375 [Ignicoccus pacificus DSM 13166]